MKSLLSVHYDAPPKYKIKMTALRSDSLLARLHKLCYPTNWDRSMWSKFGAHGELGDVFLFSNLGAL